MPIAINTDTDIFSSLRIKMLSFSISSAPAAALTVRSLYTSNARNARFRATTKLSSLPHFPGSINFNPLRFSIKDKEIRKKSRGSGAVCYAAPLSPLNLQWISAVSSVVLLFTKGTVLPKQFLVPLFAIQAPASIISWMKSEYGIWAAFLALLVRLFFFIPGELELPFQTLLLVIVAPYQIMKFRGTQQGAIISLVIAAYMAFQHFSGAGTMRKAFDQGSIIATIAIVCITVVSCLLLI